MSLFTSVEKVDHQYSTLSKTFSSGRTKDLSWRKWQLKQFWWMIADNEHAICQALESDLNRSAAETTNFELNTLKGDIKENIAHFEEWAADEKLLSSIGRFTGSYIRKEPRGVALIIGTWNYPFMLLLQPAIAATAAGCCVLLKASELAPASQKLLEMLVPQYLDPTAIAVVTGGPEEMKYILDKKFDHIFFTGSEKTARHITATAARNLTPTVLELGGQGPAVVCRSANIDLTAKRIAWAKILNSGQICVTVNHVLVEPEVYNVFLERLNHWLTIFEKRNKSPVSIINQRHFDRLSDLLDKTQGTIRHGGRTDSKRLFISPTVVTDLEINDPLLSGEIFGPICPVLKATTTQARDYIASLPYPLAMYIFTEDRSEIKQLLDGTNSGGVTINDIFVHYMIPGAPFGGVGQSGHGSYHGVHGFNTFTHPRVIAAPPTWIESLTSFRYPPYELPRLLRFLLKDRVSFKRGETLEDQRATSSRLRLAIAPLLIAALLVIERAYHGFPFLLNLWPYLTHPRVLFNKILQL